MQSASRIVEDSKPDKAWSIIGYVDRLSVPPGGKLSVMVSTDRRSYTANVLRLGGTRPETVAIEGAGTYTGRVQPTYAGSYVVVPPSRLLDDLRALTVHAWMYPTNPTSGREQGIITRFAAHSDGGWGLFLDGGGRLVFRLEAPDGRRGEFRTQHPLRSRGWYEVTCSYDPAREKVRLIQHALDPWLNDHESTDLELSAHFDRWTGSGGPLLIGAGRWRVEPKPHAEEMYDGKIENPSIFATALDTRSLDRLRTGHRPLEVAPKAVVSSWDFSAGISSAQVSDSSPNGLHGVAVNLPMRASTGHGWKANEQCYVRALDEYAAIHFHSDDLDDASWEPDFELAIPAELPSGVYTVHLSNGSETDDVPFYVLPLPSARARIAFLAPTFTYLAYGNKNSRISDASTDAFCCLRPSGSPMETSAALELLKGDANGQYLAKHPELGLSLYDYHADGSGCCYSSRLRPIVEMRPDHRHARTDDPRHFSSDLLILQWLERKGHRYDVITDEDLHFGGVAAVSDYSVVISGSHPEYCSSEMLDALNGYVDGGGNLMYLGGNGFYWVTSVDPVGRHTIEVRRANAGTRAWSSEPGETFHSTTAEFGGLWRHRGRAPNQLVGVGFSGIGSIGASGYTRDAGSLQPEVGFIFRGLVADEVIGDFGAIDGGAAGDEVDRMDFDLGTPPATILLASAKGLPKAYTIPIEDNNHTIRDQDATHNPRVRGDMVYVPRANGGAVFSVGSINWGGSLSFNNDDNNVSRVTENVLRHFLGLEQ